MTDFAQTKITMTVEALRTAEKAAAVRAAVKMREACQRACQAGQYSPAPYTTIKQAIAAITVNEVLG